MPCSCALRPASSAATWAAYGVDLREPLKPFVPDDDQAIVLPCASVIVIIVLLNDALTCATPDVMFFFSRLRTLARPAGAAVSLAIRWSLQGPRRDPTCEIRQKRTGTAAVAIPDEARS